MRTLKEIEHILNAEPFHIEALFKLCNILRDEVESLRAELDALQKARKNDWDEETNFRRHLATELKLATLGIAGDKQAAGLKQQGSVQQGSEYQCDCQFVCTSICKRAAKANIERALLDEACKILESSYFGREVLLMVLIERFLDKVAAYKNEGGK